MNEPPLSRALGVFMLLFGFSVCYLLLWIAVKVFG